MGTAGRVFRSPGEIPPDDRLTALSPAKRALFAALREQRRTVTAADVELLRRGTGDPMVLVHPVGGEVFCYGELVRRLPPGCPVWGLAADDALRGDVPPALDTLARHYVGRLTRAGLRPALVAGWSFGGMVAYEMARVLTDQGLPCPVVVIDAMPSITGGPLSRGTDAAHLLRDFAMDLIRSAGQNPGTIDLDPGIGLAPGPSAPSAGTALVRLRRALRAQGVPLAMTEEELATRLRVYTNAATALHRHRPAPGGPPLRLVWATETAIDLTPWWRGVTAPPVAGLRLVGDHYSLLRAPAVDELARFLHRTHHEAVTGGRPTREDPNDR